MNNKRDHSSELPAVIFAVEVVEPRRFGGKVTFLQVLQYFFINYN